MRKKAIFIVQMLVLTAGHLSAQEKKFSADFSGYASWVSSAIFDSIDDPWTSSHMLHNRLNFKAYAGSSFVFSAEVRNRLVAGNMVSSNPYYAPSLDADPGWMDLSWNPVSEKSVVFNTTLDRLWMEYSAGAFQVRAGRQRINWSQALVWNPNDVFNTYSFFDFDYVERPGSDALWLSYSTSPSSAAEVAVKAEHDGKITAAALYRFSIMGFDLQFLAGEIGQGRLVAGTGWSGSAGPYSLRGEASWFKPYDNRTDREATLLLTAGADRVFSDRFTAVAQIMYCNKPVSLFNLNQLYYGGLDASQLAFSRFTAVGQITVTPMPLLNLTASAIWYPDLNGIFAGPSVGFSATEDIDISLLWQYFHSTIRENEVRMNLAFFRFRYSF